MRDTEKFNIHEIFRIIDTKLSVWLKTLTLKANNLSSKRLGELNKLVNAGLPRTTNGDEKVCVHHTIRDDDSDAHHYKSEGKTMNIVISSATWLPFL